MKILHLSVSDKIGGAAIAAFRLHSAMLQSGMDSQMLVLNSLAYADPNVFRLGKWARTFWSPLFYFCEAFRLRHYHPRYVFSTGGYGFDLSKHPLLLQADVIYIHWVNNLLSIRTVKRLLSQHKPIVWIMHDMWPLTGGCHHSFDCTKYTDRCGACPCLNSDKSKDMSYKIHQRKIKALGNHANLYAIAPSKWLENRCKESTLFKNKTVYQVPNLMDTAVFKPMNQAVARDRFNLPLDKKLILFGAEIVVNNEHKGWAYLKSALEILHLNDNYEVIIFGSSCNTSDAESLPCKVRSMGYIYDTVTLAMLYNAVDVYVSPSLVESFGQTIVEAMACATAVVAFNIGAVAELIQHEQNAYLANPKDSQDLAKGIQWSFDTWNSEIHGAAARQFVETYCSFKNGIVLHQKILNNF